MFTDDNRSENAGTLKGGDCSSKDLQELLIITCLKSMYTLF
jgi:hypothetical protein